MARKGRSPQGMRKAGKKDKSFKPTIKLGDMEFTEVPPPKGHSSSAKAIFSPQGMSSEQLDKFAKEHGRELADLGRMGVKEFVQKQKEPHLIDRVLDGQVLNPDAAPPLSALHQAKKFIFDAGASEYVGALSKTAQPLILEQHNWARAPFDVTWLEMDHQAYWNHGLGLPDDHYPYDSPVDDQIGFLIDHNKVWEFSHAGNETFCGVFQYQLHMPISYEEEVMMANYFDFTLVEYRQGLLGGVLDPTGENTTMGQWWRSVGGEVVRAHKMFVNPSVADGLKRMTAHERAQILSAGAGSLKLVLTELLMVTKPRKMFNVTETGPKRMLYKGHNLVRRAHSVVTMRLAKEAAIKHAVHHEFTSQHRQMHDVRGHWAQTRNAPGLCHTSDHEWEPLDKDHFYCLRCPAKRWWRKSHTRGELRLGDKTTDYHVKR